MYVQSILVLVTKDWKWKTKQNIHTGQANIIAVTKQPGFKAEKQVELALAFMRSLFAVHQLLRAEEIRDSCFFKTFQRDL